MIIVHATSRVLCCLSCIVVLMALCVHASAEVPIHVRSFQAPGNAVQMVYAEEYDLLFLKNTGSALRIVDTNSQSQVDVFLAINSFSDMSLTPDGRYLFVADYGGERMGYGTPLAPHWVHRFDLQSETWESQLAPSIAWKIEAVSATRVLLQEHDQHVDMMLNSFGPEGMAELDRVRADYYGDLEYSPKYSRAFHGCSGSSSREIHARRVVGDNLIYQENTGTYGSAQSGGGSLVLSTDEERLYYGRLQVESLDVTNTTNMFPEVILAANHEIALGTNTFYSADDAIPLGELGYTAQCYAFSRDGNVLWAFQGAGDMLHEYAVPEPASLALLMSGGVALLCARKRRMDRPLRGSGSRRHRPPVSQ